MVNIAEGHSARVRSLQSRDDARNSKGTFRSSAGFTYPFRSAHRLPDVRLSRFHRSFTVARGGVSFPASARAARAFAGRTDCRERLPLDASSHLASWAAYLAYRSAARVMQLSRARRPVCLPIRSVSRILASSLSFRDSTRPATARRNDDGADKHQAPDDHSCDLLFGGLEFSQLARTRPFLYRSLFNDDRAYRRSPRCLAAVDPI